MGKAERRPAGVQHGQGRRHRYEDAGKQDGDFDHRFEREAVCLTQLAAREAKGGDSQHHEQQLLHAEGPALAAVEHSAASGIDHADDGQEHEDICEAAHAERRRRVFLSTPTQSRGRGTRRRSCSVVRAPLPRQGEPVERDEDRQQGSVHNGPGGKELERPPEGDARQISQKQRRIAQRRQQPAAIGDDEDHEDGNVRDLAAMRIGAQQRPDQDHRGAGRADEVGQHGSDRQDSRVDERRPPRRAFDNDAAAHSKQRDQQGHQRDILGDVLQQGVEPGPAEMKGEQGGDGKGGQGGDLRLVDVFFPPVTGKRGKTGNRGEQSHEREQEKERQPLAQRRLNRRHAGHVRSSTADEGNGREPEQSHKYRRKQRHERSLHVRSLRQRFALCLGQKRQRDEPDQKDRAHRDARIPHVDWLWILAENVAAQQVRVRRDRSPQRNGPRCSKSWFRSNAVESETIRENRSRNRQTARAGKSPSRAPSPRSARSPAAARRRRTC